MLPSVPLGSQQIDLNGDHGVAIGTLVVLVERNFQLDRFSYVDDQGILHEDVALDKQSGRNSFGLNYGCGIFELRRLAAPLLPLI